MQGDHTHGQKSALDGMLQLGSVLETMNPALASILGMVPMVGVGALEDIFRLNHMAVL